MRNGVITSYSIHYTKLYDAFLHSSGFPQDQLPRGKGGDPTRSGLWIADYVAGEQAAVNILAALYRITSYNVCYTKLLRLP